jgi:alkanesulfonate monooxygenase SsuD/methylene tetrahydromethanopterin reductase-like flavin-dependent oxidoreductase (luciferase family)
VNCLNGVLRFGIATLQHLPWTQLVERWQLIEALGFDSAWVADHFVNYFQPNAPWFEAWTLLAALASQTSRIRLGTLVTSIPFRNPAVLARQALTVDHISHGRLELGLGAGAPGAIDPSYAMTGIEDRAPRERVARLREVVEIVDQCLRNRVTTYQGRYYHLTNTAMAPPPIQQPRPPITIGAMGPAMLHVAARYADTWNSFGGEWGAPPDVILKDTQRRTDLLDTYCQQIGRDPKTLRRSLLIFGAEAETAFDSEEAFQEVVNRYRTIGITEFIFFYPHTDKQIPMFKRIAKQLIPTLRRMRTPS